MPVFAAVLFDLVIRVNPGYFWSDKGHNYLSLIFRPRGKRKLEKKMPSFPPIDPPQWRAHWYCANRAKGA
jgi:hypothetical protein